MPLVRTVRETISVPPGTYRVRCMNIREDTIENSRNPNIIRFDLLVVDQFGPGGAALEMDAISSDRLTLKSKLYAWLSAFGMKLDLDTAIDLEEVVGMEALAQVVKKPDSEFTKVDNIIPLPAGGYKSGAPAPVQVIRDDGSVNWIAFWKVLKDVNITPDDLCTSLGKATIEELRAYLTTLNADDVVALMADCGAGS